MKAYLRPSISTVLVVFFFFVLLFLGLFAEVFESQTPEVDMAQIYANPVPITDLQALKSMKLTNKQGTFVFENTAPNGELSGPWQMVEPQALRVKSEVMAKIIETLKVIRVRNFYRLEPINVSSFSLDNPTLTMLFTNFKNKAIELKIGLINPIDNSAYLGLSTQNQIYQIDPLEMALETYDLAQLVDSKVLAITPETLASLEIYDEQGLTLKVLKKESQWVDQQGSTLSESKIERLFERLEALKSFSILENLTPEQKEFMDKAMALPQITLKLITTQGVRSYVIGEVKGQIPGTNISRSRSYALSSEERKSFVLLDQDQLKVFSTKQSDLK
jgi:hypothetical protein